MNIGTVIKKARKKADLNQKEFAAACDLSQAYLSQIETNQKEPNLATLKSIAEKLELPLPILLYFSLEAEDISESKREAFLSINNTVNSIFSDFFDLPK